MAPITLADCKLRNPQNQLVRFFHFKSVTEAGEKFRAFYQLNLRYFV
jgi:hypothetical protein